MKKLKQKKFTILKIISKNIFVFIIAFTFLLPIVFAGDPCKGVDKSGTPTPYGCDPNAGSNNTNQIPAGSNNTQNHTPAGSDNTNHTPAGSDNTGTRIETGIVNPLGPDISDIPSFIEKILNFVLIVGVPIVTLAIIYAGFLFVSAQGNEEQLKKAKKTLLYTLVGAALLLGSYVIASAIKGTVDDIKSTT